jgi:hypothetical protein
MESLAAYQDKLLELRENLIRTLGVVSVNILFQRALVEASQTYPELLAIKVRGEELDFDELDQQFPHGSEERIQSAFSALYAVMIVMLARMLGKEIALRLAGTPDAHVVMKGKPIARN